jgi:hypothetical protein
MSDTVASKNTKPTHSICKKISTRSGNDFETIGVAWARENGGLYIKLVGTQVIEGGFYAFVNKDEEAAQGGH